MASVPEDYLNTTRFFFLDFSGRSHAGKLMLAEVARILSEDSTPYSHVRPANEGAIWLYQKLGV